MKNEVINKLIELKKEYDPDTLLIFSMQILAWGKLSRKDLKSVITLQDYYRSKISLNSINKIFQELKKVYPETFIEIDSINDLHIINLISAFMDNGLALSFEELYLALFNDSKIDLLTSYKLGLEKFISDLLKINIVKNSSVYFAYADIVLPFLISNITKKIFIEDTFNNIQLINLLNIIYESNCNYKNGNPIINPGFYNEQAPHLLREFDYGVINLLGLSAKEKFSLSIDKYNRFKVSDISRLNYASLIEHSLKQVKKKIIVLAPNVFLFKIVSFEKELKKYLVENNLIETVISLPKNMFNDPYKTVSIIIINKERDDESVQFIEAGDRRFYKTERRKNILISNPLIQIINNKKELENISRFVNKDDIAKRNYNLNPVMYSLSKEYQELDAVFSSIKGITLREVVEFIRPIHIPDAKTNSYYSVGEVKTNNIPPFGYIESFNEKNVDKDLRIKSRLFLQPYDILLAIRGDIGRVGIMPKTVKEKVIAIQSLQIMRVKDKRISPQALYMYLKTNIIQKHLKRHSIGDILPSIRLSDLYEIPIPLDKKSYFEGLFEKEIELYKMKLEIEKKIESLKIYPAI